MNLADKEDSGILGRMIGLGAGTGAGLWYYKKNKAKGHPFSPIIDPRSSLISKIQAIDTAKAMSSSLKSFELEHALKGLSGLESGLAAATSRHNEEGAIRGWNQISIEEQRALVNKEWKAAVSATFKNPAEAMIFDSSKNPFTAIGTTLKSNSSVLAQRAFWTFEKNMRKITGLKDPTSYNLIGANIVSQNLPPIPKFEPASLSAFQASHKFQGTISEIEKALKTNLTVMHRGDPLQGEFGFYTSGRNTPLFTIPQAFSDLTEHQGMIRTGQNLHNVYAPGLIDIVAPGGGSAERLNYTEYLGRRILEGIKFSGQDSTSPGLFQSIKNTIGDVSKLLDYQEADISGDGFNLETIFKSSQTTAVDMTGQLVVGNDRLEYAKALYNEGRFTPAGSGSRFSLIPEEELHGTFAARTDMARNPNQVYKSYAQISDDRLETFGSGYSFLDRPLASKHGTPGTRLRALHLSEEQLLKLERKHSITIGDGETVINSMMKGSLAQKKIKNIHLSELDQMIKTGMSVDKGHILGRGPDGSLISAENQMTIKGLSPTIYDTMSGTSKSGINVQAEEIFQMGDIEKFFGIKGVARFAEPNTRLLSALHDVTGRPIEELRDFEMLVRQSDLKDDAAKLKYLASSFRLAGGSERDIPLGFKNMSIADAESALQGRAKELGISMGSMNGGGWGVAQINWGGPLSHTGAGNLGTIEPRLFNLLEGSNPGGMGGDISNEIMERMIRTSPDKVNMQSELMKSLSSITGDHVPMAGSNVLDPADLADRGARDNLLQKGGFVKTNSSSIPHVYVPGWENVPELHPRMLATGAMVATSEPSKIYKDMFKNIQRFNSNKNPLTEEEFAATFDGPGGTISRLGQEGTISRLGQEAALGGKGAGGVFRGRMTGSRFLTVVSETDPENQSKFEVLRKNSNVPDMMKSRIVGLPKHHAAAMFDEMEKLYGPDAVSGMRKRFNTGETIAGMVMRHPFIDVHSAQPVLYRGIDSTVDAMTISESKTDYVFSSPGKGTGSFIKSMIEGPLPGLGADKDADAPIAMFMSPDIEERLHSQMMDTGSVYAKQLNDEYRDHSIRMQLLKPKAIKGIDETMSMAERRAAEAIKLGVPAEEVGRLSANITKSHIAIASSNLPRERKIRAHSLLTYMEQTPISSKHLNISDALENKLGEQLAAIRSGQASAVESSIREMMEGAFQENPELRGLLDEGLDYSTADESGRIKGFQLKETSQDLASSLSEFNALPASAQAKASARFTAPTKGTSMGMKDIPNFRLANTMTESSALISQSRSAIASINRGISNVVNKARPYIAPIAIGAAIAGIASSVLSGGPGVMAPPPPPPSSGGQGMPTPGVSIQNRNRDDMEIPGVTQQQLGDPSSSPMMNNSAYQLDTTGYERRKSIHANIRANGITEQQRNRLVDRLNSRYPGNRMNVNINDNRRSINANNINKLVGD